MAKTKPPEPGHNSGLSDEDLKEIEAETRAIMKWMKDRENINAEINSSRKKIRALGINLDAWRASFTRMQMDPDDRDDFDRSRELCDEALGVPVQADLFAADEDDDGDLPDGL